MKKNYRKRKFVDIEVLKVEKSKKSESEMKVYNPTFFNFVLGVKGTHFYEMHVCFAQCIFLKWYPCGIV